MFVYGFLILFLEQISSREAKLAAGCGFILTKETWGWFQCINIMHKFRQQLAVKLEVCC